MTNLSGTSTIKKSIYNIFFGIASQICILSVGIIIPKLFITSYGSEVNGFLSTINQIFSYLTLLEAGVGSATIQALYAPVKNKDSSKINEIISATNLFYTKTGIYYCLCVFILSILFPVFIRSEINCITQFMVILIVGGSGVLSYFFQAKYKLYLQAEWKNYIISNVYTVSCLILSIVKICMIIYGFSIVSMQIGLFICNIFQSIYFYVYVKINYKWMSIKEKPDFESISQRKNVLIHEIAQMVFNHTDIILMTTIIQDLKIVSVYTLYTTISDIPSVFIGHINSGFIFILGQLYNTDRKKHDIIFDCYESFYMDFSFSVYSVTYMFLLPFMNLYTQGINDTDYLLEYLPLLYVSYKSLVSGRGCCGVLGSYACRFKQTQWHAIIETLINLLVSTCCIFYFQEHYGLGIYGALIGTLAAVFFRANIMVIYANRYILYRNCWKSYIKWILNISLMISVCYLYSIFHFKFESFICLMYYFFIISIIVLFIFLFFNVIQNMNCLIKIKNELFL